MPSALMKPARPLSRSMWPAARREPCSFDIEDVRVRDQSGEVVIPVGVPRNAPRWSEENTLLGRHGALELARGNNPWHLQGHACAHAPRRGYFRQLQRVPLEIAEPECRGDPVRAGQAPDRPRPLSRESAGALPPLGRGHPALRAARALLGSPH